MTAVPPVGWGTQAYLAQAIAAAAAAQRARAEVEPTAVVPLPCRRCSTTVGIYLECSCRVDCGNVDCFEGPAMGRADMPGCVHLRFPVPRFRHCPTYEELS